MSTNLQVLTIAQKTELWSRRANHCSHLPRDTAMLKDFHGAERMYLATGYTDLRRGIDGLTSIVVKQFELDPYTKTLFLFCGRRTDRMKALYWEENGFVLLYKRLESGVFQWPRTKAEAVQITAQQY